MKNFILTLIAFISLSVSAETIPFIDNDWNAARAEAKKQNKYLFVDAYTDWCYWCKVMSAKTFTDTNVARLMNQLFVPLKLEMEHNYGINVAMKYRVTAYPTFLVFTPEGKLVRKLVGYIEAQKFIGELKKTLSPSEYPPNETISTNVDLDFPDFYKKSFDRIAGKFSPSDTVVNDYLLKQKDLFSEVNYSVMIRFASLLSPANRDFFLRSRAQYEKLFGKDEIQSAVNSIGRGLLNKAIKNKSEDDLQSAISFTEKNSGENKDEINTQYKISFYEGTEKWNEFAKAVDDFISQKGYEANSLNNWSWTIYQKCDDEAIIKKAVAWMKPVIEKTPEYAQMDTYAALLYKAKQYDEAKTIALKAIELGKSVGEKTDETENLLKKIDSVK